MHVVITDDAIRDLGQIWDFLAKSSIEAADRVAEELVARAIRIGLAPFAAPVMIGRERTQTRRVNLRSWAILYEIIEDHVEILSFVQGRTNPRRLARRRQT